MRNDYRPQVTRLVDAVEPLGRFRCLVSIAAADQNNHRFCSVHHHNATLRAHLWNTPHRLVLLTTCPAPPKLPPPPQFLGGRVERLPYSIRKPVFVGRNIRTPTSGC